MALPFQMIVLDVEAVAYCAKGLPDFRALGLRVGYLRRITGQIPEIGTLPHKSAALSDVRHIQLFTLSGSSLRRKRRRRKRDQKL
jgi:hypothetical protein